MKLKLPSAARPTLAETSVLLTLLAAAAFSFYQVGSRVFACGREVAGTEVRYWLALSAAQGLLFVFAGLSDRARRAYRVLQYLTVPLLAAVVIQLALAYPRVFVCMALFAAIYWAVVRAPALAMRGSVPAPHADLGSVLVQTTVFLLATLVVHSTIAFVFLHRPGAILDDRTFWVIALVSACICAWLVRTQANRLGSLSIAQAPPLALLVIVLLRAKYPDWAYDSVFYKATIPITLADWRTAVTGVFDHTLLGTDLHEIMGSQLRTMDPAYPLALTSSLSFLALWVIAPLACRAVLERQHASAAELAVRAGTLLVVSLTEPLIAAGTAYHEPMLSLLMTAFFLPVSLAWVFLGAAVATKVTVVFIAPILVVVRALAWERHGASPRSWLAAAGEHVRQRPGVLAACLLLAALALGEQFQRNIAFTGRILGVTDTLVGLSDPERRVLGPPLREDPPRNMGERLGKTFVHVLTLDRWIPSTEEGFHYMPSSRLVAVAATLSICFVAFAALRRAGPVGALFWLWNACAFTTLLFVTQGRHLAPLSFGAAFVVACAVARIAGDAVAAGRREIASYFAVAVALAAFGDQVAGTLTNNGWDCRRHLTAPVVAATHDRPESDLERRLAGIFAQYRAVAPREVIPPSIVCENTTERKRYLGTHHIYALMSSEFTMRFVAADPDRARLLPTSILAVCFTSTQFADQILPPAQRADFDEVPAVGGVRILVSKPLMAGARATSLPGFQQASGSSWGTHGSGSRDLVGEWNRARLLDLTPADAPGGKGAYTTRVGADAVGVLLAPYRIEFANVEYRNGDRLAIEMAMPFSNSDGMSLELTLEAANGERHKASLPIGPKPAGASGPVWEMRHAEVPEGFEGRGRLTVAATSPSGDSTGDWLFVRRLSLEP